jgi:hypothetical protein
MAAQARISSTPSIFPPNAIPDPVDPPPLTPPPPPAPPPALVTWQPGQVGAALLAVMLETNPIATQLNQVNMKPQLSLAGCCVIQAVCASMV